MTNTRRLPRCVHKGELTTYFSCSPDYLWRNIITDELLLSWGYQLDDVKANYRQLPPDLTVRIYVHFEILDLTADFEAEIQKLILEKEACLSMTG